MRPADEPRAEAANPGYFSVRGDANDLMTLTLIGFEAFDTSGNPLALTVVGSDGVALQPVAVPEPSHLFLRRPFRVAEVIHGTSPERPG